MPSNEENQEARATDGSEPKQELGSEALDLNHMMNVALDRVTEQAIMHPFRTLGIAAGVGYILGRGLPTLLVRLGFVAAARVATNAVLGASLEQLGGTLRGDEPMDAGAKDRGAADGSPKRRAKNGSERRRASPNSAHD